MREYDNSLNRIVDSFVIIEIESIGDSVQLYLLVAPCQIQRAGARKLNAIHLWQRDPTKRVLVSHPGPIARGTDQTYAGPASSHVSISTSSIKLGCFVTPYRPPRVGLSTEQFKSFRIGAIAARSASVVLR